MSWEFVARMEDVLELYQESFDRRCPVVCFDERPVQLVDETRTPLDAQPGRRERFDVITRLPRRAASSPDPPADSSA